METINWVVSYAHYQMTAELAHRLAEFFNVDTHIDLDGRISWSVNEEGAWPEQDFLLEDVMRGPYHHLYPRHVREDGLININLLDVLARFLAEGETFKFVAGDSNVEGMPFGLAKYYCQVGLYREVDITEDNNLYKF